MCVFFNIYIYVYVGMMFGKRITKFLIKLNNRVFSNIDKMILLLRCFFFRLPFTFSVVCVEMCLCAHVPKQNNLALLSHFTDEWQCPCWSTPSSGTMWSEHSQLDDQIHILGLTRTKQYRFAYKFLLRQWLEDRLNHRYKCFAHCNPSRWYTWSTSIPLMDHRS